MDLKNTKSLLTGMICLTYAGLFLPMTFSNIILVALLFFGLLNLKPKEIIESIRANSFSKLMIALFLVQVIGLLYSENFSNGLFLLEKKASFVLIPFFVLPLLEKVNCEKKIILKWIGIITIASSVILLIVALVKFLVFKNSQAFFYEEITFIHYVYYSIYFATGSLILIDSLFEEWSQSRKGVLLLSAVFVYALTVLVFIASKTGIAAFFIVSILFLYKRIVNKKVFVFAVLSLICAAALLFYFNTTTRDRFAEMNQSLSFLSKDDFRGTDIYVTDLGMRLIFWKISLTQLWRENLIFFGVGTGDAQDFLNYVYTLPQYEMNSYVNWDTHNEWVFTFIQVGVMGLLVLATLFAKYLIQAFRKDDIPFLSFLIVTGLFSLTESILESNKGIVFFTLLFCLFAFRNSKFNHDEKALPKE